MKKIFLVLMYVIVSIVMFSCTDDSQVASQKKTATTANTQLTDGENGLPPITPPKP